MTSPLPVLYSFRRCPYAIRARLALWSANISVQLREVRLRDKPKALVAASPKATVPVLVLADQVIEQSFEIMLWALRENDPQGWLGRDESGVVAAQGWLKDNDEEFKFWLDRYKYFDRYPDNSQLEYRQRALAFIDKIEQALAQRAYLSGDQFALADALVLPFIRQFAFVDKAWFDQSPYPLTQRWLATFLNSERFAAVMDKYSPWNPQDTILIVP